MLSKANRLKKDEIEAIFSQRAKVLHTAYFSLRALQGPGTGAPKAAVVAGAKVFKSAVARNRVKRRLRHALRAVLPQCPKGGKVVVMAKPLAEGAPFQVLISELMGRLTKLMASNSKTQIPNSK